MTTCNILSSGFSSCTVMSFLVNAVYTAVAIAILLLLVIFIWWYSPPAHAWGSISQVSHNTNSKYLQKSGMFPGTTFAVIGSRAVSFI